MRQASLQFGGLRCGLGGGGGCGAPLQRVGDGPNRRGRNRNRSRCPATEAGKDGDVRARQEGDGLRKKILQKA